MKPTVFEDLIALVALYRPGPDELHPELREAQGEAGSRSPTSTSALSRSSSDTYGICIYQEQYMRIAQELAGFTISEADDLRKAIGKKIRALMDSLKDKFMDGAAEQNVTPAAAKQLWEDVEKAADYSFPKAHAACYALIAYQTAWLRQNHPCEYMAALISSVMNTKTAFRLRERVPRDRDRMLPPDVNESEVDFAVVEGKIRFGLNAVKGVGEEQRSALIAARNEGGPFESIWDFTERVDPTSRTSGCWRRSSSAARCPARARAQLEVLEQAVGMGAEAAGRPARGSGLDLRPRAR